MGNCMEISRTISSEESKSLTVAEQQKPKPENDLKIRNGVRKRIKVVLTKEELQWLLIQLQEKRKLEDVLGEIERCRAKIVQPWKPSLQSIMEICSPDQAHVVDQMERS